MFVDNYGFLHHQEAIRGNPETSENGPTFSTEAILLGMPLTPRYDMLIKSKRVFRTTPISEWGGHFSHDSMTALYASRRVDTSKLPMIYWNKRFMLHPRDIVYYGYMRYGFWFYPLLPIVSLANIISCARTWKKHKSVNFAGEAIKWKSLTTSGKMLAFVRNKSAGLKLTHKICTWLIKRNKHFGSWTKVAKIYFPNEGHPIPILMEKYEKGL